MSDEAIDILTSIKEDIDRAIQKAEKKDGRGLPRGYEVVLKIRTVQKLQHGHVEEWLIDDGCYIRSERRLVYDHYATNEDKYALINEYFNT